MRRAWRSLRKDFTIGSVARFTGSAVVAAVNLNNSFGNDDVTIAGTTSTKATVNLNGSGGNANVNIGSATGATNATVNLNGSGGTPKTAFYRHDKSYVALLKIDGKTVRKVAQADVGGLAEGIAFGPDGRYLYVGNSVDGNIDILHLEGDRLTKVGSLALLRQHSLIPTRNPE